LSDLTTYIGHTAGIYDIPVETLEKECLDFLHTGSESGFQHLRLVLDTVMDARRGALTDVKIRALKGPSDDHFGALHEIADVIGSTIEADPAISEWARPYAIGHAWRVSRDIEFAIEALQAASPGEETSAAVLEVGSAPYLFTLYMQQQGYNVHGLDLDPTRQRNLIDQNALTVITHDLEGDDPGADLIDQYDLIVFNEVFEHLRINPLKTLRKLHSWLKPGGKLILSTPNAQSLDGFRKYITPGVMFGLGAIPVVEYGKLETIGHMGHVREYTAPEVMHTLKHTGFITEVLTYRFSPAQLETIVIPHVHARWGSDMIFTCRKGQMPDAAPAHSEDSHD